MRIVKPDKTLIKRTPDITIGANRSFKAEFDKHVRRWTRARPYPK
jgi:hypothetical protein